MATVGEHTVSGLLFRASRRGMPKATRCADSERALRRFWRARERVGFFGKWFMLTIRDMERAALESALDANPPIRGQSGNGGWEMDERPVEAMATAGAGGVT